MEIYFLNLLNVEKYTLQNFSQANLKAIESAWATKSDSSGHLIA